MEERAERRRRRTGVRVLWRKFGGERREGGRNEMRRRCRGRKERKGKKKGRKMDERAKGRRQTNCL